MANVFIYRYRIIPLIKILSEKNSLREQISFLHSGKDTNATFLQLLRKLKIAKGEKRDEAIHFGYIENFGRLKWILDKYNLRTSIRHTYAIEKMHPNLRPYIPLYANKKILHSIINTREDIKVISANEYIEIYPYLFATYSIQTYAYGPIEVFYNNVFKKIKSIIDTQIYEKKFKIAKQKVLKFIFKNFKNIKIEHSSDFWVIFIPYSTEGDTINLEDILTINFPRDNVVIFGRKTGFDKLLRKRILRTTIIAYAHKILLRESIRFIKTIQNCKEEVQTEFPYYFVSELNYTAHSIEHNVIPELIYSRYLREIYTKIAKKQNYDVEYNDSLKYLKKYLESLDFNKQRKIVSRNGYASTILKDLIVSTFKTSIYDLEPKYDLVFQVLFNAYIKDLDDPVIKHKGARTTNEIYSMAKNLESKYNVKITSMDFYPIPGELLKVLMNMKIIKSVPIKKGAAKYKFAINDENPYVKRKILDKINPDSN